MRAEIIYRTTVWGCQKCGHQFLSEVPVPCPECGEKNGVVDIQDLEDVLLHPSKPEETSG